MSRIENEQERDRLREILDAIDSGDIVIKQGSGDVVSYIEGRIRAVDHVPSSSNGEERQLSANG